MAKFSNRRWKGFGYLPKQPKGSKRAKAKMRAREIKYIENRSGPLTVRKATPEELAGLES